MSEGTSANAGSSPALEKLDEAECLRLISPGGIGRIAFTGRYGLSVFPVNYKLHDGTIVFLTAQDSPTGEDLSTGIAHAEYQVAFEIDQINPETREGWSVLIHGPAHHMSSAAERAAVTASGVTPWPRGAREHAIQITPTAITGRRLSHRKAAGRD